MGPGRVWPEAGGAEPAQPKLREDGRAPECVKSTIGVGNAGRAMPKGANAEPERAQLRGAIEAPADA